MAVVDANLQFLYVSVGVQGRVSDGGLFSESDLKAAMDRGLLDIPPAEPLPFSDVRTLYLTHL